LTKEFLVKKCKINKEEWKIFLIYIF
jgi:hypothetical protein